MDINLQIEKRHVYFLALLIVFVGGVLFVQGQNGFTFGHAASDVIINVDGEDRVLQEVVDEGGFGVDPETEQDIEGLMRNVVFKDSTSNSVGVCIDHHSALVYEKQGTKARIYVSGSHFQNSPDIGWNCGGNPGYWNTNSGKVLFYEFDWKHVDSGAKLVVDMNWAPGGKGGSNGCDILGTSFDVNSEDIVIKNTGTVCEGKSGAHTVYFTLSVDWENVGSGIGFLK